MNYFEKNPRSIKYLERLIDEWKTHGKIVIAVDFDDTISPWKLKDFDPSQVFRALRLAQSVGAYITLFSACKPDRFEYMIDYCKENDLQIDSINKNPIDLPYGNDGKVFANIFIDDRAGLNEALNILSTATSQIIHWQQWKGEETTTKNDYLPEIVWERLSHEGEFEDENYYLAKGVSEDSNIWTGTWVDKGNEYSEIINIKRK